MGSFIFFFLKKVDCGLSDLSILQWMKCVKPQNFLKNWAEQLILIGIKFPLNGLSMVGLISFFFPF